MNASPVTSSGRSPMDPHYRSHPSHHRRPLLSPVGMLGWAKGILILAIGPAEVGVASAENGRGMSAMRT